MWGGGLLWQLRTRVPRIGATDGSAWPTPTVSENWAEGMDRAGQTAMHNVGLGTMVRRYEDAMTLPTPQAADLPNSRANIKAWGGLNSVT
jgi:hypothetical protein